MEQYVHTLIAADPAFVPRSLQVERFFEILTGSFRFRIIAHTRFQPGLRVLKPSGRFRSATNSFTGETFSFPMPNQIRVERIADVPPMIESLEDYNVLASGEWVPEYRPLVLLTTDGVPFEGSYNCEASCHVRPEPVSTSCWNKIASPNGPSVLDFGEACRPERGMGIFWHPWTGKVIEVPRAGCARFWIELEFGKFLLPKMADDLDLLNPAMVAKMEECFGAKFVQGYRFN
jgi:hypothetical protein